MPDLEDLLADSDNDTDLVKSLRRALKDANKEAKEVKAELEKQAKANRTRSLADALKEKGLPEKAAKYFPVDKDPTPEAIEQWLQEDGDLFGIEKQESNASTETVSAAGRISAATADSGSQTQITDFSALIAAIQNAKSGEELAAVYAQAGMANPGDG